MKTGEMKPQPWPARAPKPQSSPRLSVSEAQLQAFRHQSDDQLQAFISDDAIPTAVAAATAVLAERQAAAEPRASAVASPDRGSPARAEEAVAGELNAEATAGAQTAAGRDDLEIEEGPPPHPAATTLRSPVASPPQSPPPPSYASLSPAPPPPPPAAPPPAQRLARGCAAANPFHTFLDWTESCLKLVAVPIAAVVAGMGELRRSASCGPPPAGKGSDAQQQGGSSAVTEHSICSGALLEL